MTVAWPRPARGTRDERGNVLGLLWPIMAHPAGVHGLRGQASAGGVEPGRAQQQPWYAPLALPVLPPFAVKAFGGLGPTRLAHSP